MEDFETEIKDLDYIDHCSQASSRSMEVGSGPSNEPKMLGLGELVQCN